MTPETEFFNFELKQKLNQLSWPEFHGDSDDDGFKALKPIIERLIGLN